MQVDNSNSHIVIGDIESFCGGLGIDLCEVHIEKIYPIIPSWLRNPDQPPWRSLCDSERDIRLKLSASSCDLHSALFCVDGGAKYY